MAFPNAFQSDVGAYARGADATPFVTEANARVGREGFVTLERWLGENNALYLLRDRVAPLAALPWTRWVEIFGERYENDT